MAQDLAISFSAISLLLWVMLWLLGTVKTMLTARDDPLKRSHLVVPGLLYAVAVLIGFTVIMFVGFIIVPSSGSSLLANIGIAVVVVQSIIIILAPYIIGSLWLVWIGLMMQLLVSFLSGGTEKYSMASLLSTFVIAVFVVFVVYAEFMWIVGRKLNGIPKYDIQSS